MIRVGITGGIGSGKSTACRIFSDLGVPVFDSDAVSKSHLNDEKVKRDIVNIFGAGILNDGKIDTKKLGEWVFGSKDRIDKLSDMLHGLVIEDFKSFCAKHEKSTYCLFESAIIYEKNLAEMFDKVIVVTAARERRIARVMDRSNMSRKDIVERMKYQIDDELKIAKSDFVITNNGEDLSEQVWPIHFKLMEGIWP